MTDTTPTPTPEQPANQPSFLGIGMGTILTSATSLITGLLGAGPWGIAGMAGVAIAGIFGYNFMVKSWNSKVDAKDQANAGADAGRTAVDLANQAAKNKQVIDELQKQNPPTKG